MILTLQFERYSPAQKLIHAVKNIQYHCFHENLFVITFCLMLPLILSDSSAG
jgi:hypothetical protein